MLVAKAGRHIPKHSLVQIFGEPIHWVDTARYVGLTLDTRLTWSTHIDQVSKKAAQRLGVSVPLLNRSSGLSVRNIADHPSYDGLRVPRLEVRLWDPC